MVSKRHLRGRWWQRSADWNILLEMSIFPHAVFHSVRGRHRIPADPSVSSATPLFPCLEVDLAIGEEGDGVGGRLPLVRARRVEAHHGVADAVDTLFVLIVLGVDEDERGVRTGREET